MLLFVCVAALFISLGSFYQTVDITCGTWQEAHIEYKPSSGWLSVGVSQEENFIYGIFRENLMIRGSGDCYEHFFTTRYYNFQVIHLVFFIRKCKFGLSLRVS